MSDRFRFALKEVEPAQWQAFERLASEFLSDEYGALRTLAAPEGDGGRDAMLFQPENDDHLACQYSVAGDWEDKIRRTARRLANKYPKVQLLIYASPREIGAAGDRLRMAMRTDYHLYLDLRDRHWFVEREARSPVTKGAAEKFCHQVADPVLVQAGVMESGGSDLTTHETRAALLYLVLQREDDDLDRQLTKLCFDALVRAVLRGTDNSNRMSRSAIRAAVRDLVPSHEVEEVEGYTDRALERLTKRSIRHWTKEDDFCLEYQERLRLAEGIASLELLNQDFNNSILTNLLFVAEGLDADLSLVDVDALVQRVRRVMERFLFERGESFVESLNSGQTMMFVGDELREVTTRDLSKHADTTVLRHNVVPLVSETIERTMLEASSSVQHFLRAIADAYTLFAFLRETPNVQSAVTKLFSHGEIWLDTTAVLPLLAEELLEPESRSYTRIIEAAQSAGVKFRLTAGVLDEIASHIDLALRAWRGAGTWTGRTPFLLSVYVWSGRKSDDFPRWLETFRGRAKPLEDLILYFADVKRIRKVDLGDYVAKAPDELRWHTEQYWYEVHEKRRRRNDSPVTDEFLRPLVAADVECFLGVIERRGGEQVGNPFGYTSWWLSMDRYANTAAQEIAQRSGLPRMDSPVLSLDFLTYYLAVGPARRELEKSIERSLPMAVNSSLLDALPKDLLAAAEDARHDVEGQDDRVVRRKIRDHLDKEKLRGVRVGRVGIDAIKEDIRDALARQAGR